MIEIVLMAFTLMLDAEKQVVKDAACGISDIQFESYASSNSGMTIYYKDGSQLVKNKDSIFVYDKAMNERYILK